MTTLQREVLEDLILDAGTPDTPAQPSYVSTDWVKDPHWEAVPGSNPVALRYVYWSRVLTFHPAVPAVPGRPEIRQPQPPAGWDAYASSIEPMRGDARARFNIGDNSPGLAIGFILQPDTLYNSIGGDLVSGGNGFLPGLFFLGDKVYRLQTFRNGIAEATYTAADRFSIEIDEGGTVMRFRQNDKVLWQEPNTYGPGHPLYLSATLYDRGALVSNAEFAPLPVKPNDGVRSSLVDLRLFATDTPGSQLRVNLEPMTMRAGDAPAVSEPGDGVRAELAPPTMRAGGAGTTNGVRATLAPLAMRATGPAVAPTPAKNGVRASLRPLVLYARGLSSVRPPNPEPDPPTPELATFTDTAELDVAFTTAAPGVAEVLAIAAEFDVAFIAIEGGARVLLPVDLELEVAFLAVESSVEHLVMDAELDVELEAVGADTDTWAVNLAGGGSTRYTQFPFESFARIGRRYYGAGRLGICELAGDTDAGNPIDAVMDLGDKDFGSVQKKKPVEAWATMSCLVPMVMQLRAEGELFTYRSEGVGPHLQARRFKFGKGSALQTTFINPILRNEGGADFTIDALQFDVQILSRKN